LDFHGEFRECEFPLEELEALEKTLKAISISLGSSVGAFDGSEGLIRVYHTDGWIDLFYRSIGQPQWDPLWELLEPSSRWDLSEGSAEQRRFVHLQDASSISVPFCCGS
jgi:hypothetical protein